MKPIRWFRSDYRSSAVFFFTAVSLLLSGCYTHLATSGGGYYTYHPRPVYSDTIRGTASLEKPLVKYDTTMHGDTMFIDERQVQPEGITSNGIAPDESGNTIINNYYGSGSYWDNYWGPSWGISVGFGWPYYNTWYSPWWPYYYTSNYFCDWWRPYGYFGYYPPYYNCYAPYYAGYYYPGYYGYGYYGRHDYGDHFYGDHYGHYGNIQPGRVGGEYRAGVTTARASAPAVATMGGGTAPVQSLGLREPNLAQANAADILRTAEDRNAPVHVISPDASAALARSATAPAIHVMQANPAVVNRAAVVNAGNPSVANTGGANTMANIPSHPIIVRRMDGQTVTTMSRAGRQTVIVRRAANYGSSSYGFSRYGSNNAYRSNGYQGSGYRGASRGYSRNSAPSQGYSAPARSYTPSNGSSGRGYSGGSYNGGSARASSGSSGSSGGGGNTGRASGGEGRAR